MHALLLVISVPHERSPLLDHVVKTAAVFLETQGPCSVEDVGTFRRLGKGKRTDSCRVVRLRSAQDGAAAGKALEGVLRATLATGGGGDVLVAVQDQAAPPKEG